MRRVSLDVIGSFTKGGVSEQDVQEAFAAVEDAQDVQAAAAASAEATALAEEEEEEEKENIEESFRRAEDETRIELKALAGKDSEHMAAMEKALPMIQQRSIRFKEVCEPIAEVTPQALRAELEGLEEEEREWEKDQTDAMKEAEEEIQRKDNGPTPLETTGVSSEKEMRRMYLSYRRDIDAKIRKAQITGIVST